MKIRLTVCTVSIQIALLVAPVLAGGPVIDSINRPVADRSERLEILGGGFGEARGEVRVDGFEALIAQWADDSIIAYVPERSNLGATSLEVFDQSANSDVVGIVIRARRPNGRERWRFAVEGDYMLHSPGASTAGAPIYVSDLGGRLYAVDAAGGLLWIVDALRGQIGGGSEGPVAVGDDGTVYVGVNPLGQDVDLVAVSPAGEILWVFTDPGSWSIAAGPAIGPDGNIYVVFHGPAASVGAVSLAPDGTLLWNNPGSPVIFEAGGVGAPIAFGASVAGGAIDQMNVTVDNNDDRHVYAFALEDGQQRWAVTAAINEVFEGQTAVAASALTGLVYISESNGWGLQTFAGIDGSRGWRYSPGIGVSATNPTVGPDGTAYIAWEAGHLGAVAPDGTERWQYVAPDGTADGSPRVTPDNRFLLMQGFAAFEPGWIKGLDPASGALVWQVDFGTDGASNLLPGPPATITTDSRRAYLPVAPSSFPETAFYTYAYSVALAGIEVWAAPIRTSVAPGGALRYLLELENFESTVEAIDLWVDVVAPDGGASTTVTGPIPLTIAPGARLRRRATVQVPADAGLGGPYEVRIKIGVYPDGPVSSTSFGYWVEP